MATELTRPAKVEEEERAEYEAKILSITDPKQARILAAAVQVEQCMTYYTRRNEKGQVIAVDIFLDFVRDKAGADLIEALTDQ